MIKDEPIVDCDGTRVVVGEVYCGVGQRELTVRKTYLFYPSDGYAAYDHASGELIFRVDMYARRGPTIADQLVLMDPSGASILTVRRKWPSLHQRWEGFLGERTEGQKPLFTVRRSSIFGGEHGDIAAEVHCVDGGADEYRIEGSFAQRCCRVLYEGGGGHVDQVDGSTTEDRAAGAVLVAEIKRKVDESVHVVLGKDVFSLCLRPRFDAAFAMGLVLILDQISSGNGDLDTDPEPSPSQEGRHAVEDDREGEGILAPPE